MPSVGTFLLGALVGASVVGVFFWLRRKDATTIAQELVSQTQGQREQDLNALLGRIKDSFGALSLEALSKNTAQFLQLAGETLSRHTETGASHLETKKLLIDQTLEGMKSDLRQIQNVISDFEKDRTLKYGEITSALRQAAEQTAKLQETAGALRTALAGAKARGQWGERMAEDVLRLVGFVENVNYRKQKALESVGSIPDYTFLLPQNLSLNMDVKFPLDNYLRFIETDGDAERKRYKEQFLKDVRQRVKEVTSRDYINPSENTVDYVLVFIPNEQVYAFINENDRDLLDEALKEKVILCSPLTLYAILAVIRQAVDNFNLEKTAGQMLALFGTFNKQWHNFVASFDKMGEKLDDARTEFDRLVSTRRKQLEKPLSKIEDLRRERQIPEVALGEGADADSYASEDEGKATLPASTSKDSPAGRISEAAGGATGA